MPSISSVKSAVNAVITAAKKGSKPASTVKKVPKTPPYKIYQPPKQIDTTKDSQADFGLFQLKAVTPYSPQQQEVLTLENIKLGHARKDRSGRPLTYIIPEKNFSKVYGCYNK